jgi:hypothetical protein
MKKSPVKILQTERLKITTTQPYELILFFASRNLGKTTQIRTARYSSDILILIPLIEPTPTGYAPTLLGNKIMYHLNLREKVLTNLFLSLLPVKYFVIFPQRSNFFIHNLNGTVLHERQQKAFFLFLWQSPLVTNCAT